MKYCFVIGTGRNGSTLISDILACHSDFTWVSNYQDRYPKNLKLSYLNNFIMKAEGNKMGSTLNTKNNVNYFRRLFPRHSEAYKFWNHYSNMNFSNSFMANEIANNDQKERIRNAVDSIAKINNKKHFFSKLTGPSRVKFLKSIFPEAKFIHLIRDPRHVLKSYLEVDYWKNGGGYESEWWEGILTDSDKMFYENNKSPEVLAALQIRNLRNLAQTELEELSSDEFIEMNYNSFLTDPKGRIEELLGFLGLEMNPFIEKIIIDKNIYQQKKKIPFEENKIINSIFQEILI